ncbi:MAG: hypothetical protein AB7L09_15435 [Nitrospira sp.]
MSGTVDERQPSYEEIWFQEIRVRGVARKYPRSRSLTLSVVEALLSRLEVVAGPTEATWLRREIQFLAGIESFRDEAIENSATSDKKIAAIDGLYSAVLFKIARSELPRERVKEHSPDALRYQRMVLYTMLGPCYKHLNGQKRRRWLRENWHDILSSILAVPCWCKYPPSDVLNLQFDATDEREGIPYLENQGAFQDEVLANLHNLTDRRLKKLLGPQSR